MRILFTRFPLESADGGAENQTMWLIEGLRSRGHEVSFLGSCPVLLRRTRELGIMNYELRIGIPPVTKWGSLSFLWRKKNMQEQLVHAMQKLIVQSPRLRPAAAGATDGQAKPKAIVMLSLTEKILLTPWALAQGIAVVWVEHDRVGSWLRWNPWLPTLRKLSSNVTTVCVSELSRKIYIELGFEPGRVVAIANGVSEPKFQIPNSKFQDSQLRLACIARLSPEKGVDRLIEAISDLPEVDLTIVGKGREGVVLRSMIDADTVRMGGERIRIVPSVSDLDAFYASTDVLVLPSREHDPFGLVAAEAMMRGVPVIVTDACGIAGYLKNGHDAIVVRADSADDLKSGVIRMSDAALRLSLSANGRESATRLFSLERMVNLYEEILTQS